MKLLEYSIHIKNPTDKVTLIPFGCVHADDPGFRPALFRQCIQRLKDDPNAYGIGMGDYQNFLRGTARKHLQSYVADENSFDDLDPLIKNRAEQFYKDWLKPIEKKLIGLAEGNHYYQNRKGITDTQWLCEFAGCNYLDKPAFLRLKITYKGKWSRVFKVLIHHGDWSGGYSRIGGDFNAMENKGLLGFGGFDIFLFGHTHRKGGFKVPVMDLSDRQELRLIERTKLFVRTGCFMAGYDPKCAGTYAQKKLLAPTDLGWVEIGIRFYREYDKERTRRYKEKHPGHIGSQTGNFKYEFELRH